MIEKYITHSRAPFFEIARKFIKSDSVVLDVGPGDANFSDHFNRTDFFLFEGNPGSAAVLREKHPNTFEGRLPDLPFDDATFDVIHCSHVVEHLEPQVFYDTLKEMDRTLKPGGVLIVSAPLMWEGFYNDLSHVRPYSPKIYMKYLGGENPGSLTRTAISKNYFLEELKYRFTKSIAFGPFAPTSNPLLMLAASWLRLLNRLGMEKLEKTGYTIVLRKK